MKNEVITLELAEIFGFIGGFLTTVAYLPQVIKSWQTKSTKDLSLPTLIILNTGFVFWQAYAFMINSAPLLLSNGAILVLGVSLLYLKLKYK